MSFLPSNGQSRLDGLIQRGRQLRDTVAADPVGSSALVEARAWQQDCAAMVHQLSGGSKAHWLARAYSEAFLVRSRPGHVVEHVALAEIVDRIVDVLGQAVTSLSRMVDGAGVPRSPETAPPARRFDFVRNSKLRPVLEQAYLESRSALERGDFGRALILSSGLLETVITDALEHLEPEAAGPPGRAFADWDLETRIAAAERAGLIHGGCARLPPAARRYRDLTDVNGDLGAEVTVSERDARLTRQVLHVVMRDLDPGR